MIFKERKNKFAACMLIVYLCGGCTPISKQALPAPDKTNGTESLQIDEDVAARKTAVLSEEGMYLSSADEDMGQEVVPTGFVFGKTRFDGVVKTSYVQLMIRDIDTADKTYKLIIGDKARQQKFPWETQTVKPGYFFIELPPGDYRVISITIPVGTSTATESMDITFKVHEDKFTYLGTLDVIGTREKIKLGGVPVIQPGFEYSVDLLDEGREAQEEFKLRYPDSVNDFEVGLMRINRFSNMDAPIKNPQ